MESSRGRRMEKRGCEESLAEEEDDQPNSKKQKLPGLASVIVEALKVDSLQRLCSSLEPLFRRIVSEEVERALTRLGHAQLAGRSSPPKIQCPEGKSLQLCFMTRMPPHLFTGGKVEGERGAAIHVVLQNACTGCVVQTGPESSAKLNVVVLEGDFNEEPDEDWSEEHFEGHEVKEREGKQPLLTGELQVTLKEGLGTLGDLTFTDNSSWIRSRKFRLGVKVAPGTCPGLRVREAKTEAFAVKDHRGELYKKHYPPALHDEVWRLDRIAKDGALHKKLIKADVITVEDFLHVLVKDQQRLRTILGSGMSNRMWENTVEHAKTCVLGGKLYVYYADGSHGTGIVFNHIYELRGLIADGQFIPLESLTHSQKISVESLVKGAYENWSRVIEYDGKVLTALPNNNNKGTRALPVPASDMNHSDNVYVPPTQSRQQCNNPTELSPKFQAVANNASVPNLIEFPLVRSEATPAGGVSSSVQALPSSMDYTPAFGASTDWVGPREGQAFGDFFSEEIRLRSSEMLESDDMQRLLRNYGVGVNGGIASPFGFPDEGSYNYVVPSEHQVGPMYERERRRGSGKAVVGWLKLKAALRWGIFVRKKAAERRAQLIELD